MRYQIINIISGKMIFETNDLAEAKLGLTNTNRIIIDTDSGKCRDESGMLNLNNEDDLVRVIANCRYE